MSSRVLGSHRSFSVPHVPGVMHRSSSVLRIGTIYGGTNTYNELSFEPYQPQGHQVKLRRSPVSSRDLRSYRAGFSAELISAGFKRTCSTLYTDGATELRIDHGGAGVTVGDPGVNNTSPSSPPSSSNCVPGRRPDLTQGRGLLNLTRYTTLYSKRTGITSR